MGNECNKLWHLSGLSGYPYLGMVAEIKKKTHTLFGADLGCFLSGWLEKPDKKTRQNPTN
jgi:hypothetical protein